MSLSLRQHNNALRNGNARLREELKKAEYKLAASLEREAVLGREGAENKAKLKAQADELSQLELNYATLAIVSTALARKVIT